MYKDRPLYATRLAVAAEVHRAAIDAEATLQIRLRDELAASERRLEAANKAHDQALAVIVGSGEENPVRTAYRADVSRGLSLRETRELGDRTEAILAAIDVKEKVKVLKG